MARTRGASAIIERPSTPRLIHGLREGVVIAQTADWHYYDLPADLIGTIWKGKYCGQRQMWFAMRFTGTDADVNIATHHPEFRSWRW